VNIACITARFKLPHPWIKGVIKCHNKTLRPRMLVALTIGCVGWSMLQPVAQVSAGFISTDSSNSPMGVAKGVCPGRVVWVRDPEAATWNATGNWWDDACNSQSAIDNMLSVCLRGASGADTDTQSWDRIFHGFNQRKGRGDVGYAPGEAIAIKINMNNTSSHANNNNINASPHLVLALLKQLVNNAGVAQSNITVCEPSRFITDNIYGKCHAQFPDVVFVDNAGNDGRVKSAYLTNAIPFSINNTLAKGIATCFVNARYVINMAVLKGHVGQGITFCGKNYYGATSIYADWTKNKHDYFDANDSGVATYMTFTDFLGHKDLGEKTMLFIIDALYGCKLVNGVPGPKWNSAPFSNAWPSSIFLAEDGVAVDSVALDFFRTEFPTAVDLNYCDFYLHEAAQATNPPSGQFYDPERDGVRCASLGVHEHWNNAVNKQYTRNLGTGVGIELYRVMLPEPAFAVAGACAFAAWRKMRRRHSCSF